MKLPPFTYILTATLLSLITVVTCILSKEYSLAVGVLVASGVLLLNLGGWVWSIKQTIIAVKSGENNAILTAFSGLKFFVLLFSLLAIVFLFGSTAVLISNTIIVLSLLLPMLVFEFQQKGISNEC